MSEAGTLSNPVIVADPVSAVGVSSVKLKREQFWNLPNTITMMRIAIVPLLFCIPFALSETSSTVMAWLFIVAASSDLLDGYLARRSNEVTRTGKLLDPLADKLLVTTALVMLMAAGRLSGIWAGVMVVVIIGRELAVTGLRGIASSQGHVVGASWQGKLKAVSQNIAVGALLFHYPTLGLPAHEIGMTLLAVAAALTLWSGYVYFAAYFAANGAEDAEEPEDVPAAPNRDVA